MKKILTDCTTGEEFTILYKSPWLPALGEDGIQYFVFTQNLTMWNGKPRDDCKVVDLRQKIAIKAETCPRFGKDPVRFIFDKESFDSVNSISEYAELIRKKGLINNDDYEDSCMHHVGN